MLLFKMKALIKKSATFPEGKAEEGGAQKQLTPSSHIFSILNIKKQEYILFFLFMQHMWVQHNKLNL